MDGEEEDELFVQDQIAEAEARIVNCVSVALVPRSITVNVPLLIA
jgi:hypothetical protein